MNRPDLYFKTVRILLDAYLNETLFHSNWETCACANIIATNMGYRLRIFFFKKGCVGAAWRTQKGTVDSWSWGQLVQRSSFLHHMYLRLKWGTTKYQLLARQLSSTGYTRKELRMIGEAFDLGLDPTDKTVGNLAALKRVLFTLKAIHGVDHYDVQASYRRQFLAEMREVQKLPATYDCVGRYDEMERRIQLEVFGRTVTTCGETLSVNPLAHSVLMKKQRRTRNGRAKQHDLVTHIL